MSRYKEMMKHVTVTPAMRERVLQRVAEATEAPEENDELAVRRERLRRLRILRYSKIAMAAAAALLVLGIGVRMRQSLQPSPSMVGTESSAAAAESSPVIGGETEGASGAGEEIANPFVTCAGAEELKEVSGLPIAELTWLPFEAETTDYSCMEGELAQIVYTSVQGDEITYRVASGSKDPSGDYTEYEDSYEITTAGRSVSVKGSGGLLYLAYWTEGSYAYSIDSTAGLSKEDMIRIVDSTLQ